LLHLVEAPMEPPETFPYGYLQANVNERFDRLDLRCVVGLHVTVHGPWMAAEAVKAAAAAAAKAGASSVLGFSSDQPVMEPEKMVFASGDFSWLA
jgi:hypothetical protein